jgi:TyrR family helix-turn-helix protein
LQNIIKNAVVMSEDTNIDGFIKDELKSGNPTMALQRKTGQALGTLAKEVYAVEKNVLLMARKSYRSTRAMARHLGVSQATVVRKMKKHGLASEN